MCGATGEVRLDGLTPDITAIAAMADAMVDRGPDGAGVWSAGRVALGHRRLKIIDLTEAGSQPMVDSELGLALAALLLSAVATWSLRSGRLRPH